MTQRRPTSAVRLLLSRALLVIAVLTGLGAMHVVASPAAAHAAMPMVGTAATSSAHAAGDRAADLASAAADDAGTGGHGTGSHGTGGHGLMADCLLFAATGATLLSALLTAAAARRWLVLRGTPGSSGSASRWTPVHRRPPPAARPLIALCVIRT